jgi:hypothetical protein
MVREGGDDKTTGVCGRQRQDRADEKVANNGVF